MPTFVQLIDKGDDAEADRLASGLLGIALAVLGIVTVVGIVAAPLIARLLTVGVQDAAVAADQRALETYLLRWFLPQLMLYGCGAIATAVLYARRRFAITAAAPIANTIVMVAALFAFRVVAGPEPTLDLTTGERMLLVIAGTGGVIAFVAVLIGAARRNGFSLRPRWLPRDPAITRLLRLSAWGVLLHANAGILLGAAIVVGSSIAGGAVAYQVAYVFFLAPYAVLAQPVLTAVLPELVGDAERADHDVFARRLRSALDRMAVLVLPVSAIMVALALPLMRIVAFGRAEGTGVELLAAALAALAVGLFPYGAFLLLARAYYALGDTKTPAFVALGQRSGRGRGHDRRRVDDRRSGPGRSARYRPQRDVRRRRRRARVRRPPSRRGAHLGRRSPTHRDRRGPGRHRGMARRDRHRSPRPGLVAGHRRRRWRGRARLLLRRRPARPPAAAHRTRGMTRSRLAVPFGVLAAGVGVVLALAGVAPAPAAAEVSPETRVAERVLVVAIPEVSWADLADADLPAIDRFAATAALGQRRDADGTAPRFDD